MNSRRKKRSEKQGRKEKIYPTKHSVPENSKERKKAFFSDQGKEIEESYQHVLNSYLLVPNSYQIA